jgi:hypothetical protein
MLFINFLTIIVYYYHVLIIKSKTVDRHQASAAALVGQSSSVVG